MKLLDSSAFEAINSALRFETPDVVIVGRIESYSCKMAGRHKKLFKRMNADSSPNSLKILSPSESTQLAQNIGRGCSSGQGLTVEFCAYQETITQKTFSYLISTLNASYDEFDFSECKSEEFSREGSYSSIMQAVENQLSVMGFEPYPSLKTQLWGAIDHEIHLSDCEMYRYTPDANCDPFVDAGFSRFFHYFFYNKSLKRIVFFTCHCIRKYATMVDDTDSEIHLQLDDDDGCM